MKTHITRKTTFPDDIAQRSELVPILRKMQQGIEESLQGKYRKRKVRSLVVKLKFSDFTGTTAERANAHQDESIYTEWLEEAWSRGKGKLVRLFGIRVRLCVFSVCSCCLDLDVTKSSHSTWTNFSGGGQKGMA